MSKKSIIEEYLKKYQDMLATTVKKKYESREYMEHLEIEHEKKVRTGDNFYRSATDSPAWQAANNAYFISRNEEERLKAFLKDLTAVIEASKP